MITRDKKKSNEIIMKWKLTKNDIQKANEWQKVEFFLSKAPPNIGLYKRK